MPGLPRCAVRCRYLCTILTGSLGQAVAKTAVGSGWHCLVVQFSARKCSSGTSWLTSESVAWNLGGGIWELISLLSSSFFPSVGCPKEGMISVFVGELSQAEESLSFITGPWKSVDEQPGCLFWSHFSQVFGVKTEDCEAQSTAQCSMFSPRTARALRSCKVFPI